MKKRKMIGVVGGLGPLAGLDLCKRIIEQTHAVRDQEHLPVAMLSLPGDVSDRTEFILGKTQVNPAFAIVDIIKKLESIGASVVGIACNTAHAPQIYNVICSELVEMGTQVRLLNTIYEVTHHLKKRCLPSKNIGVLSTLGCYASKVYEDTLTSAGFNVIVPDERMQEEVIHRAIYDHEYGIKAKSGPVDRKAKLQLKQAVSHLKRKGADVVVLGCTELSLALTDRSVDDVIIVDSTTVMANALIREAQDQILE